MYYKYFFLSNNKAANKIVDACIIVKIINIIALFFLKKLWMKLLSSNTKCDLLEYPELFKYHPGPQGVNKTYRCGKQYLVETKCQIEVWQCSFRCQQAKNEFQLILTRLDFIDWMLVLDVARVIMLQFDHAIRILTFLVKHTCRLVVWFGHENKQEINCMET